VEEYDEYQLLNEALDRLVAEMARIEPNLVRDEAREELSDVVRKLIRSAGPVD
jgi:RNA polymerase-interacting CarD/CdnL/TRCF family regulator